MIEERVEEMWLAPKVAICPAFLGADEWAEARGDCMTDVDYFVPIVDYLLGNVDRVIHLTDAIHLTALTSCEYGVGRLFGPDGSAVRPSVGAIVNVETSTQQVVDDCGIEVRSPHSV